MPMRLLRALVGGATVWLVAIAIGLEPEVRASMAGLALLLVTLFFAVRWGLDAATPASLVAGLAFDYYFQPPLHTLGLNDRQGYAEASVFLLTAIVVSHVSALAEKHAHEAERRREEIERLDAQILRLAAEIQRSMLPARPFDGGEVDLHATIVPAKEVGGDFYDYFRLPDGRLCFLVGDVSDKGIPAALYMASVITAFQILARTPSTVAGMVTALNRYLCENNRSQMFVTVFACALDLRTGAVEYCDGGHEPPFVLRTHGKLELLEKVGGMALGVMPDYVFRAGKVQLQPGETLLLYTDGVNEAANALRGRLGVDGMRAALSSNNGGAAADTCRLLLERVTSFAGGAAQSDDVTLLAVRYLGNGAAAESAGAK